MANEKRYIDAAELDRKLEALAKKYYLHGRMEAAKDYSFVQTVLLAAPTLDAVEVPCRCKKCKYWRHYEHLGCTEYVKVCTLANYMIGENGYCLYGERREGE